MKFSLRTSFLDISPKRRHQKNHLWIVCSDPAQCSENILLLKSNTWKNKPGVFGHCLLRPGDHEFINRKSYINYNDERLHSLSTLKRKDKEGRFTPKEDVSVKILKRIHKGARQSPFLSYEATELLKDQGFI